MTGASEGAHMTRAREDLHITMSHCTLFHIHHKLLTTQNSHLESNEDRTMLKHQARHKPCIQMHAANTDS